MARSRSPFACRIEALTPAERARRTELFARLSAAMEQIEELPDGFALQLARSADPWLMKEHRGDPAAPPERKESFFQRLLKHAFPGALRQLCSGSATTVPGCAASS